MWILAHPGSINARRIQMFYPRRPEVVGKEIELVMISCMILRHWERFIDNWIDRHLILAIKQKILLQSTSSNHRMNFCKKLNSRKVPKEAFCRKSKRAKCCRIKLHFIFLWRIKICKLFAKEDSESNGLRHFWASSGLQPEAFIRAFDQEEPRDARVPVSPLFVELSEVLRSGRTLTANLVHLTWLNPIPAASSKQNV